MRNNSFEISKGIDWMMVLIYVALVTIGIASIFATTYRDEEVANSSISSFV
jgi:rod shape determining protein RodA